MQCTLHEIKSCVCLKQKCPFPQNLIKGSLNFFAMFGAFASNWFSDNYGRRQTFIVAALGFIGGIIVCALSPNFGVLIFGRAFVGLGVGVGMAVSNKIGAEGAFNFY